MAATDTVPPVPESPGGEGLFVRKSSGLVREVGVRDTFGIAVGILVLMGVFPGVAIFLQAFPNADFYLPILIGAVISLALAYAYTQLVATFPRSGGEYVYASRTFGAVIGAAVGGAVFVAVCLNCANTVVQLGQIFFPFMFTTIGKALHIHALETFGTGTFAHKTAWLISGLAVIGFYMAVSLRPISTVAKWVFWSFAVGLATYFLIVVMLLLESHGGFVHDFNAASLNHDAYGQILAQARHDGFSPGVSAGDVFAVIPVGALVFSGFTFGNYAAGEIKRPLKTYKTAVLAALVVAVCGAILGWAALRHAAGLAFLQSSSHLAAADPDAYGKLTAVPNIQGGLAYSVLISGDPVTKLIIALGTVSAFMANGLAYFALTSRVVFALSFDRLLPTRMADVRERTHAPVNAVLLVAAGVLTLTVLGDETSVLTIFRNLILVVYAIFVIGSICAAALPYRRPDLFAASPKVIQRKILGVPGLTVVGAISAIAFAVLDYDIGTKTAYSGGYSASSVITLVTVATVGVVLYAISRFTLSRRGIDLRLAMHELPPE